MTRVRFAPSPTGFLHIGGVRTALFNWLYARSVGGEMLLRIEDTHRGREVEQASARILADLRWLGLDWDGPEAYQLDSLDAHRRAARRLVSEGKAYERDGAVLLSIPEEGEVAWRDVVKGELRFQNRDVKDALRPRDDKSQPGDLILLRADGVPLYNFAAPYDDAVSGVTDVIRGDDHVSNTPKQIHVLRALGCEPPRYAHLPMVLDDQGKKLSKRSGAGSVEELEARSGAPLVHLEEFRDQGYLPEALLNHLALLGWSPGAEETILPLSELVARFRLEDVNPAPARFDYPRLDWMNGVYLRELQPEEFSERLRAFAQEHAPGWDEALVLETAPLVQGKLQTLGGYPALVRFLFEDVPPSPEADPRVALAARARLAALPSFDADSVERALRALPAELDMKPRDLFRSLYPAVCGQATGPSLFHSLPLLGRERALARLDAAARLEAPEAHSLDL